MTLVFLFSTVYPDLGMSDTYTPIAAIEEVELLVEESELVANVRIDEYWFHVGNAHDFLSRYNEAAKECR
jgi:hypothetical protein